MILADTSVWIDCFHGGQCTEKINKLIDLGLLCTNDVILAELIPSINHRCEYELRDLILSVPRLRLQICWKEIISMQTENLKNGINKVGLADLIIAQNAMQHGVPLFSCDKHFQLMASLFPLSLSSEDS